MYLRLLCLGLMSVLFAGCGESVSEIERAQQIKADASEQLKSLGGQVTPKDYPGFGQGMVVELQGASIDEDVIDCLAQLERVSELNLAKSTVTDEQFAEIAKVCGFLTRLDLSNTAVTDACFESMSNLGVLRDLNVAGTKVTAAGIQQFQSKRKADPRIRPMFKNTKVKS